MLSLALLKLNALKPLMRSLSTFWHLPPRHLGHPSPEQREEMALNDADRDGTVESLMEGNQSKNPCVSTVAATN